MCLLSRLDFEILQVRTSISFFPESLPSSTMLVIEQMIVEEFNRKMYKGQNQHCGMGCKKIKSSFGGLIFKVTSGGEQSRSGTSTVGER